MQLMTASSKVSFAMASELVYKIPLFLFLLQFSAVSDTTEIPLWDENKALICNDCETVQPHGLYKILQTELRENVQQVGIKCLKPYPCIVNTS